MAENPPQTPIESNYPRPNPSGSESPTIKSGLADMNLGHLALIIIFGIFATTLPQPQVLGKLSLQHILKGELHVTKTVMASFFFLCGIPWYFKPFTGILTDAFPLGGTRRRHYILISAVLACISWIGLGFVPHTYSGLLWGCIVVNLFMVMMSTVVGAFLVESGHALSATGRLTSVRQFVSNVCGLINGPLGGWLASGIFLRAAGVNSALVFSIFPFAYIFLRERKQRVNTAESFRNAGVQLKTIFRSPTLWFAIVFLGLFYFSPGFGTPLYYRQTGELKFNSQFIGNLGVFAGLGGMLAVAIYSALTKFVPMRTTIFIGVILASVGTLFYLFYNSPSHAIIIEAQNGFVFGFAEVALIDLAARATPVGCEGLGYSLILSVRNIALFGADIVGSALADHKVPFNDLVYLNAGTTVIVLVLIPFMPQALLRSRDGEPQPEQKVAPVKHRSK